MAFQDCDSLTSVTFQGAINPRLFSNNAFPGDLHKKFYAANKTNGTPGTYTRPNGESEEWTLKR
jgi:hypothetical protein